MGIKVQSTRVACATSNGTQDITIADFGTPKAAFISVVHATADGTATDGAVLGYGLTDGTVQVSICAEDQHGQDTTDNYRYKDETVLISILDGGGSGSREGYASFDSWIANGIRIDWTDAPPSGYLLIVTLFGGTDLSVYAGDQSLGTGTSSINITSVGFEADVVLGFYRTSISATGARISTGFAHNNRAGTVTARSIAHYGRDAQGTSVSSSHLREDAILTVLNPDAEAWYLSISDFDADGFTIQPSSNTSSQYFSYLALRFGADPLVDGKVYTYTTPTSTGSNTDAGAGFTPQAILYFTGLCEAAATVYSDNRGGAVGYAAIDATAQYHNTYAAEDGEDTSDTQSLSDDQAFNQPDDDGTTIAAATFTSFGATGATYSYSTAPATAKKWIALAIEAEAGEPPAGRTTKNTDSHPLGIQAGISRRVGTF